MTGPAAVVELAAFQRLDAGLTLAPVYQDVPENTPPPVVIVGDIDATPFTDDPDDIDARVSLSIVTVTAGSERVACTDIQDEIEAVLRGARVDLDGWSLAFRSLGSDAALDADGEGYVGTTRFEVIAFHQG